MKDNKSWYIYQRVGNTKSGLICFQSRNLVYVFILSYCLGCTKSSSVLFCLFFFFVFVVAIYTNDLRSCFMICEAIEDLAAEHFESLLCSRGHTTLFHGSVFWFREEVSLPCCTVNSNCC